MSNSDYLAHRLREVILNGTWIANTNYKDQLENLDLRLANTKFLSFNTISVLAQHVHYYVSGIENVFTNNTLEIKDAYSFDFPLIESQKTWDGFLDNFWSDTEKLAGLIAMMPENNLDHDFVDGKYGSYRRNIDGLLEHSYYHLGQIVLINKALTNHFGSFLDNADIGQH